MSRQAEPNDNILVAADGSPASEVAASIAIQIAASLKLAIHGLYVVDEVLALDNTYANVHRELGTESKITSRSQLLGLLAAQGSVVLDSLLAECQSSGIPATTETLFGGVPELVLQRGAGATLVAVGRRGHGHAEDPDHLGRNFRAIARRSDRPMLVGGEDVSAIHRLLLAYKGSRRAHTALTWVSRLRDSLPAEVSVLSVQETDADEPEKWLAKAHEQLTRGGEDDCWCLQRSGAPAAEIVAAAEEIEADLIVMGRFGHSALVEWLTGSTVERVLRNTRRPVLMI